MAKQIRGKDIIEDQHLDNAIKSAEQLLKTYKQLDAQIVKTAKHTKAAAAGSKSTSAKGIQQTTKALRDSNNQKKAAISIDKQILAGEAKLSQAYSTQSKRLANLKLIQQRKNQLSKEEAVLNSKASSTYEKLSIQLNRNRKALKELILTEGHASKATKKMQQEVARLDSRLKKADAAAGQFQRSVGGYRNALKGAVGGLKNFAGALGVIGGVRLFTSVLRDSFNIIRNFDQATANLSSVLGVNKDEMAGLTEQAKLLGATTKFTAAQVSELQLEFAKLGFTQKEINDVTEATLSLASAAGTDLATAATVTGATIRGFGLDTKETQRVVDVMAKSFSSSSLDMAKFQTAMAAVAPVAATMGVSIEETTALIGTLTDSGIDASTAGTGLRNMFLDSNKAGLTFDQALEKINSSTDKVGTSFKLFGKRGATLGVILAKNQKATAGLEKTLQSAGGAAKEMADKQLNTLQGSLDLLRSAWEGYILGADGAGGISEKLQKIIKFLANNLDEILSTIGMVVKGLVAYKVAMKAVNLAQAKFGTSLKPARIKSYAAAIALVAVAVVALVKDLLAGSAATQALSKATEEINEKMDVEVVKMDLLRKQLLATNKGSRERKDVIDEINRTYGTTLTNLNDEKGLLIEIEKAYRNIAAGMRKKIGLEVVKEDLKNAMLALRQATRAFGKGTPPVREMEDAVRALEKEYLALENSIGNTGQTAGVAGNDIEKMGKQLQLFGADTGDAAKEVEGLNKELEKNEDIARRRKTRIKGLKDTGSEFDAKLGPTSAFANAMIKANEKLAADRRKRIEELKKFRAESIKIFEDITNARVREIDKQIAKKQEDVNDSKDAISNLQKLAAKGNTDAAESIKAERIKLAKDKLDIERLEKKKRNLLIQVTALQSANSLFEQGNSGAFKQAGGAIQDFLAGLPQFYSGTDGTVADALGRTGTKDGHLARIHDNEHIIGANDSDKLHAAGFNKTSDIVSAAMNSQSNLLTGRAMLMSGGLSFTDAGIIGELREVKDAIKNMEHPTSIYDQETGKETMRKGDVTTTFHHKQNTLKI